jgi:hypothetical protein
VTPLPQWPYGTVHTWTANPSRPATADPQPSATRSDTVGSSIPDEGELWPKLAGLRSYCQTTLVICNEQLISIRKE